MGQILPNENRSSVPNHSMTDTSVSTPMSHLRPQIPTPILQTRGGAWCLLDEGPCPRSRTVLFRGAFARRRGLVPATGFLEWEKRVDGRQPCRFVMKDLELFARAGLWEFAGINGEFL